MINDPDNSPPTSQTEPDRTAGVGEMHGWLRIAQSSFRNSVRYMESNYRKTWDDAIRAFNNEHTTDSKYSNPAFDKRSKLYRPKIRTIIRKNEAAAAAAFFSSMDVVSVSGLDPNNKTQAASADVNKALLQYRLTKSIPWFQTVMGGLQDAQTTGVVCAHVYWDYEAPKTVIEVYEGEEEQDSDSEDEYPDQVGLPKGTSAASDPQKPVATITIVPMGDAQRRTGLPPAVGQSGAQPAQQGQAGQQPGDAPQQPAPQSPPQTPQTGAQAAPAPQPGQTPQAGPQAMGGAQQQAPKPRPIKDKPCVDLIPAENLLISPAANWVDPINTSPFVIHLIPMYVMDVREKMETGEWNRVGDSYMAAAMETKYDSTRTARLNKRTDPYGSDVSDLNEYSIVWVQRHIHKKNGEDWEFYMLSDLAMLTEPRPLKETVFHGKRPYVMGCCVLESHKPYPGSVYTLGRGLADESNEIVNQRMDNVKFVLNKMWIAKRGKQVDIAGLVRNTPGRVIMTDDPTNDVREISWPDVTQSAYEEQSRIDNDMNDLLGNFSAAQVMADHGINGPARNMQMLGQNSGTLVEYLLRTYVETFIQPVLRQLVMLEQKYETDTVLLNLASSQASLMQRFGSDQVTNDLLEQELTLTVNVGMGATDPQLKAQKFLFAMQTYIDMLAKAPPGINMQEVGKEIFSYVGYQDGTRFLSQDDPQKLQMAQQLQQAQQLIGQLQQKVKEKETAHMVKLQSVRETNQTKIIDRRIHEDNENLRNTTTHLRALEEVAANNRHQAMMKGLDHRNARDAQSRIGNQGKVNP